MKQAGRTLGKVGLAALWLKQHSAAEESMAQDLKGYFTGLEQQVLERVTAAVEKKLDELADDEDLSEDELGDLAEEMADELIDVDEVYEEVIDVVREHIYDQVATGAMTEWKLSKPEKALDLRWLKTPWWAWKDICRDPAGQFSSCDGGAAGATSDAGRESALPTTAADAVRGKFDTLPDSKSETLAQASEAAKELADVSITEEADEAVDLLAQKQLGGILDRYGSELGAAIVGAGFLAGLSGTVAAGAVGAAVTIGSALGHHYAEAAASVGLSLMAAPYVGNLAAKYAMAPLIGAARFIHETLPYGDSKATGDMTEVKKIAEREWVTYLEAWDKQTGKLTKSVKADPVDVGGIVSGLRIDLPTVMRDSVERYAQDILSRPYWRGIAETIRDDIATDVRNGVLEGLSGRQIRDSLKGTVGSDARAENIARTETTGSLNGAAAEVRNELAAEGLVSGKSWLCILDQSFVHDHEDANEQIVAVDEPFVVGDEEGMFPGDPDFSPAQRCRCRCTALSTFSDEEITSDEADKWSRAMQKWYSGVAA